MIQKIVKRIILFRNLKKISQFQMSKIMGVSYRTYQRIENLETTLDLSQLFNFCRQFDFTPSEFLDLNNYFIKEDPTIHSNDDVLNIMKLSEITDLLIRFYKLFQLPNLPTDNICCSEQTLKEVFFNKELLNHTEDVFFRPDHIKEISKNTVLFWELLDKSFGKVKYFLGHGTVRQMNNEMVKVIGLTKDLTGEDRVLRSFSYLHKLPSSVFVSNESIYKIRNSLNKVLKEPIEVHAPLI